MATYESPDRSEWKSVWLGTDTTPPDKGWYPVEGEVRTTRLATFERKVTIGDATKDSDDFVSSYVIGDFSGGGQILDINEGSDTDRFWFGVADTRYQNQTSLPPEVMEFTMPGTVSSNAEEGCFPVGDLYDSASTGTVFLVYYNGKIHQPVWTSQTYPYVTYPGGVTLSFTANKPSHPGVSYAVMSGGSGGSVTKYLFVPSESGSYRIEGNGSPLIVTTQTSGSAIPSFVAACEWNGLLWGITPFGLLYKSSNARDWTLILQTTGGPSLQLDLTQKPSRLVKHTIGSSERLLAVTDEQVWMLTTSGSDYSWTETPVKFPQKRMNGKAVARWRSGEDLWIGVGPDVIRYTTSSVLVPNSGPVRDDGLPESMYKESDSAYSASTIVSLVGEYNHLYALLQHNNGSLYPDLSLMCWTGTGWHCLWQGGVAATPNSLHMYVSSADERGWHVTYAGQSQYRLYIPSKENKIYAIDLRKTFHNVKAGARAQIDRYASTTKKPGSVNTTTYPWIETGRFDANMTGFNKLASHLSINMEYADANNGIKLWYQTDADLNPTQVTSMSTELLWHEIPSSGATINTIGISEIALPGVDPKFNKGIPFQWIRFKIEFVGQGGLKTPILNSIVLHYTKIPQDAASFVLTVPLPRETYLGRTGQEMADDLQELLVSNQFIKLVHQNKTYRVRVAGLSGADSTGDDLAGARTVNLIEIDR